MSEGQKLYTVEHWQKHKGNYKNYEGNIEAEKLQYEDKWILSKLNTLIQEGIKYIYSYYLY